MTKGDSSDVEFRRMDAEDVSTVIEWAAREGWNPGLNDGSLFHAVDPDGWFGAYHDGNLCGSAVVTNYDDAFSFAGFYIVSPPYRNKDIGTRLTKMAMDHAGERCLALDGVMKMAPRYEKVMGMKGGYNGVRFHGISNFHDWHTEATPFKDVNPREICDFDAQHFPSRRNGFVIPWMSQPGAISMVSLDRKGSVDGIGTLRPCRKGYKVGPLFACGEGVAEMILHSLLATIPGEDFFLDVPDVNASAMRMVERMGLKEVFRTARMYSKDAPEFRLEGVYGVTSFELG